MTIVSYADRYYDAVIQAWNDSLTADPIDGENFCQRILWDPNFDPEKFLLAVEGEQVLGFLYAVVRLCPDEIAGLDADNGWIVAFGVRKADRKKGIGKALLARAEEIFRAAKVQKIAIGPYTTNYISPGVDIAEYADGVAFLTKQGYASTGQSVSMDVTLHDYRYPEAYAKKKAALVAQGYQIREFEPGDTVAVFEFMQKEFPYWKPAVRDAMRAGLPRSLYVAIDPQGQAVGFVMRAMDGSAERFGPFGVAEGQQGKSIGSLLFNELMEAMRKQRIYHTHFLWTTGRNLDIYGHWGMKIYRTYEMMSKKI